VAVYLHAPGCPCDRLAAFCGVVMFGCRTQACIHLHLAAGHKPLFTYIWLQDTSLYSLTFGCRTPACIHLRLAAGHKPLFTYIWLQDTSLYSLTFGCRTPACIHLRLAAGYKPVFIYALLVQFMWAGIATGYGLDGPGIESRWWRNFPHLSRPALGPPTHPSTRRVFPGVKSGRGVTLTPHPLLVPWSKKGYSYTSTPPMGRTACTEPQCLYKGALCLTFPSPVHAQHVTEYPPCCARVR